LITPTDKVFPTINPEAVTMNNKLNTLILGTLITTLVVGCSKTEIREDTTMPTKNQTRIYARTANTESLRATAIKLAETLDFEGSFDITRSSLKNFTAWEQAGYDYQNPQKQRTIALHPDSWEVSYGAFDPGTEIEHTNLGITDDEVLKRATTFFETMGLNLKDYKLEPRPGSKEYPGTSVTATLYIDGAPVDFFAAPYKVRFWKNYQIIDVRLSAETQTQIGVASKLSPQQALQNDPTRTNTPLTGTPTPTVYAQQINTNTSLLIPGYNLPIIKGIDEGVSVLAIDQTELQQLTKKAQQLPTK
jgi:hypothetical protein